MYLADTLSCALLLEVNTCKFSTNLDTLDHISILAINDYNCVQQIEHASVDYPVLQVLHKTILDGWPECEDSTRPAHD